MVVLVYTRQIKKIRNGTKRFMQDKKEKRKALKKV